MIDACLLTGPTRGAIATIAVCGHNVKTLIQTLFRPQTSQPIRPDQLRFGTWVGRPEVALASESVVVVWKLMPHGSADVVQDAGPRSVGPGEQPQSIERPAEPEQRIPECWEIHCHGGVAAAQRILDDLAAAGARRLQPTDWLRRWGDSGDRLPLLIREATELLQQTTTARTAGIALDQVRGALQRFVSEGLRMLQNDPAGGITQVAQQASQIAAWGGLVAHLVKPWRVVLAGSPNVGKSSLVNAILGYRRSITLDLPGTTRDVLEAVCVLDGWPVRLSDTAGIATTTTCRIEQAGIDSARRALASADLICWVLDASQPVERPSNPPRIADLPVDVPRLVVANKIDLVVDPDPLPGDVLATSTRSGQGIEALCRRVVATLVPEVPDRGQPLPTNDRQLHWLERLAACQRPEEARQCLVGLGGEDHAVSTP